MITYFKFTHGAKAGRAVKAYLFPKFSSSYCCCVCRMCWSRGRGGGKGCCGSLRHKRKASQQALCTHTHTCTRTWVLGCVRVCVALCNLIMGPAWTATPLCGGSDACGGGWQIAKNCTHILLFKSPTTNTHTRACVFVFFPAFSAPFATPHCVVAVVVVGILFALFWLKLCTFSVWLSNTIFFPLSSLPSCFFFLLFHRHYFLSTHNWRLRHELPQFALLPFLPRSLQPLLPAFAPAWLVI